MSINSARVPFITALYDGLHLFEESQFRIFQQGYYDGAVDAALGKVLVEKKENEFQLRSPVEDVDAATGKTR